MTGPSARSSEPRIKPGGRAEIGAVNTAIAWIAGRVAGTGPLSLFTTLAGHRRLFRGWLLFVGRLMPPEYEWRHHERIAQAKGMTGDEVARVRAGVDAPERARRKTGLLVALFADAPSSGL